MTSPQTIEDFEETVHIIDFDNLGGPCRCDFFDVIDRNKQMWIPPEASLSVSEEDINVPPIMKSNHQAIVTQMVLQRGNG
jgi:hypothetical protein